ncbi:MAG: hypothetical protein WD875_10270 [Pirellulales bacterium]
MNEEPTSQRATLGCGTLILIALIVLLFSRPGVEDLEKEVKGLRGEVVELKATVEGQTRAIEALEKKLAQPKAP